MPALLAPGLWSLVVSAGLTLSYQAGARAEARAEQVRPPIGDNTTTEVLEIEPTVGLAAESSSVRLELDYAPRLTHLGGDGPDRDSWLQRAWVTARWRPVAGWIFQANGIATAGTVDLFRMATAPGLPGAPPPVGQAAPVASILDYRRFELALAADGRLSRDLELRSSLVLMREGGTNEEEREVLPLQQAALLRGELAWRMSGRTTLGGTLTATTTHYFDVAVTGGGAGDPSHQSWSIWTGRAAAFWRRTLTGFTRVWAGGGVALVDSGAPGAGPQGLRPIGEVGLAIDSGTGWPRFTGGVLAAAAPFEDRLTGTVANRAEARALGSWSPAELWTLGVSALGARVMDGATEREAFTAGDIWLTRAVRDVFSVTAGGRWTSQWPAPAAGRSGLPTAQWVAYVAIQATYRSRPGRASGIGAIDPLARPTR